MKYIKKFETIDNNERKYFLKYMNDYYGINDGIMPIFTKDEIENYIDDYMNKRDKLGTWGGADSFDREVYRDYLLFKYKHINLGNLEHGNQLRDYFTEEEINASKYNL